MVSFSINWLNLLARPIIQHIHQPSTIIFSNFIAFKTQGCLEFILSKNWWNVLFQILEIFFPILTKKNTSTSLITFGMPRNWQKKSLNDFFYYYYILNENIHPLKVLNFAKSCCLNLNHDAYKSVCWVDGSMGQSSHWAYFSAIV